MAPPLIESETLRRPDDSLYGDRPENGLFPKWGPLRETRGWHGGKRPAGRIKYPLGFLLRNIAP
jgi:hypothetical protein